MTAKLREEVSVEVCWVSQQLGSKITRAYKVWHIYILSYPIRWLSRSLEFRFYIGMCCEFLFGLEVMAGCFYLYNEIACSVALRMSGRIRTITNSWNVVQKSEVLAAAVEDRLESEVARKFGRLLMHIGIRDSLFLFLNYIGYRWLIWIDLTWFDQICQGEPLFVHFV